MGDTDYAYQRRQMDKERREQYRLKARKMVGTMGSVGPHANVVEDADGTGAFVECTIFVPANDKA
jgi:Tfp pilus assembly protein PilP